MKSQKKYSQLFYALFILFTFLSQSFAANEGGISAGGGGALPEEPISIRDVFNYSEKSKRLLRLYFNFRKLSADPQNLTDLERKFFFATENMSTQLEKTDLDILADRPCYDQDGDPVDASVTPSKPNTICMSAFRIAPKLIHEVASKEITALIAHEISHLIGASEEEAVALQKETAKALRGITWEDLLLGAPNSFEDIQRNKTFVQSTLKTLRTDGPKAARAGLTEVHRILNTLNDHEGVPFSYLDQNSNNHNEVLKIHLYLVDLFLTAIDSSDENADQARIQYEKCFGGKSQVTTSELIHNCLPEKSKVFDQGYVFKKETLPDQAIRSLKPIQLFFDEMEIYIFTLIDNHPLPLFTMPTDLLKENPWKKFVGKYKAEEISCDTSSSAGKNRFKGLTSIEILQTSIQDPIDLSVIKFIQRGSQSGKVERLFYNSTFHMPFKVVTVTGDETTAVTTSEDGSRWFNTKTNGSRKTVETVRRTNNELRYKLRLDHSRFGPEYMGPGTALESGYETCEYRLILD